jgi:phosphatidate cytidylyltransferase
VGSRIGKKKLYESVSPNKSWEGIIGGAIFCLCCAYINNQIFEELDLSKWLILGLLVIVFGTLGDLVQSLFKRSMQVKDTGAIFPGHGGILDRFDGVLFSIPFIVFYLQLLKIL